MGEARLVVMIEDSEEGRDGESAGSEVLSLRVTHTQSRQSRGLSQTMSDWVEIISNRCTCIHV